MVWLSMFEMTITGRLYLNMSLALQPEVVEDRR